jgi:2-amino-4-hydroxy-6-hydroxymethyldihydropteridine diphosphokinase
VTIALRNTYMIALGSNATDVIHSNCAILGDALRRFNESSLKVDLVSDFWRTPAFPAGAGPDFANACAQVSGPASPIDVLNSLHRIESDMGRVRERRWGQRVIDLDLLAAGDLIMPDAPTLSHWIDLPLAEQQQQAPDRLILPHPRLQDRAFVLVPLAQVAPDWRHPVLGRTVIQMRDALDPAALADMHVI